MSVRAKNIIEKADIYLSEDNHREKYYSFLEKFSKCEVYCRPILRKFLEPDGIKPEEVGLDAKTIRVALGEYGIYFENDKIIFRIFGAEDKPGISSCRWLRNKSLHELMNRALKEICERYEELNQYMDDFILQVESQL